MTALSVSARALCKSYALAGDRKKALDKVSFHFSEGERIGVIGRNGAGKTTLLQLIAGIGAPTSGQLEVNGQVTAVFTLGLGLREDLTGRENILIDGELQGHSRARTEQFLPETIAFAELGEFIDRPVRTYSTGMKARLAFSMLVHIDPEILIVDEALSVGDARFSAKATAKMRELAARGRMVILVSHSMSAVRDMCTRCLWLDDGKIRMDGSPDEVTAAYLDCVRQTDEQALVRRFREHIIAETLLPGWAVDSMQFRSPQGQPMAVLQTGEPTLLHLDIAAPPGAICQAEIEFFRLDGVSVCISKSTESMPALRSNQEGRLELLLDFFQLPLNYGIYAVRVVIKQDAVTAARRTVCVEVVNAAPHKGGRPALVVPTHLYSERIS